MFHEVVKESGKEIPAFFSEERLDIGEVGGEVLRKDGAFIGHVVISTSAD